MNAPTLIGRAMAARGRMTDRPHKPEPKPKPTPTVEPATYLDSHTGKPYRYEKHPHGGFFYRVYATAA